MSNSNSNSNSSTPIPIVVTDKVKEYQKEKIINKNESGIKSRCSSYASLPSSGRSTPLQFNLELN